VNNADLISVSIKDFRSISGRVNIPLDAPIVIIHGVNGAGKSSVLTAIELALTGAAAGLARGDETQTQHLVHRGRAEAEVSLSSVIDGHESTNRLVVAADGSLTVEPALSVDDRRTFVERCYLAQSTVSRLLDIYQNKVGGESALTRFVKDLLGLDRLEALIDGLFPVGDRRRLRNLLPALGEVESEEKRLKGLQGLAQLRLTNANLEMGEAQIQLAGAWAKLLPEAGERLQRMEPGQLLALEMSATDGPTPTELEATRQELLGLRLRVASIPADEQSRTADLENRAGRAATALAEWQGAVGTALNSTLERLSQRFPDLPTLSTGPTLALRAARERVGAEKARIQKLADADARATREMALAREQLSKAQERGKRLSAALVDQPDRILGLTEVLVELVPHLDGEVCPVCERDYSEISRTPLADHLAKHVASMNFEAKRLQGVVESIREGKADERRLTNVIEELAQSQLSPEGRVENRRMLAELGQDEQALAALSPLVERGDALFAAERETRAQLLELRNATSRTAEVRQAAAQAALALGTSRMGETEPLEHVISRLLADTETRLAQKRRHVALRSVIAELSERLAESLRERDAAFADLADLNEQLSHCQRALEAFDARRDLAKNLASEAEAARTRVVRQVFNHSLNRIWRDLFVRLVPSEPFVPAFRTITGTNGRVAAELETQHRDGGTGGNPSYMLSAGNLNTGAVTLFLALHLSVDPRLPWLILDDPVQSMDEVHIAQFAALLRTLAKHQDKKLIIAVHERSLFEYLALELSPAFPGDKLITVELSRPDGGITEMNPEFITWQDDRAFAVS
jgi:exonuclease SbcC